MRKILYKYPLIYDININLSLIKDIYIPIYDKYDNNFTTKYYELVKELFAIVPRYEESIEWSKFIWKKDLENNIINL